VLPVSGHEVIISRDQPSKYYAAVDGMRGLAILLVLIEHWWAYKRGIFGALPYGDLGVTMFFVLSGFLISEILFKSRQQPARSALRRFWWRRVLRIFPVFYLYLAVAAILRVPQSDQLLLWNLTYTTNIYNSLTGDIGHRAFSHIWSLCVEEQFYLVWPILALLLPRRGVLAAIVLAGVGGLLFRVLTLEASGTHAPVAAYRLTVSCLDALCLGSAIAYIKTFAPAVWKHLQAQRIALYVASVLSLAILVACTLRPPAMYEGIERSLSALFAGSLLIVALLQSEACGMVRAGLENLWLR
jgi:peptidoglycan/LPS O-acetylase OafA/YrhL